MSTKQTEALKLALPDRRTVTAAGDPEDYINSGWNDCLDAVRKALAEQPAIKFTDKMSIDVPDQPLFQKQPAQQEQVASDGWLQSDGLLYRLTDERKPQNRDEINVTMADGSRSIESRTRRAGELLDRIRSSTPASKPLTREEIIKAQRSIDPEGQDICGWSFTEGVRWAERHRGITGEQK